MLKRICVTMLLILYFCTSCSVKSEQDPLRQEMDRIEYALGEEFEAEYKKQRETEVIDYHFASEDATMVYYICQTTYYAEDPSQITGVDTDAVLGVFPVEDAELEKEFDICEHPSAIYRFGERSYLCCTPNPEHTLVLEYSPEFLSEEDAVKTMRSVFEPVE